MALFLAFPLAAQDAVRPAACVAGLTNVSNTDWTPPLDRTLTPAFGKSRLTLREALDKLAAIAGIRLSYSAELLPLDRSVCVPTQRAAVGYVLTQLLAGTGVAPVAIGSDQVVLAPRPVAELPKEAATAPSMSVLEKMVVTESAMGAAERRQVVNSQSIDGRQLARENAKSLANVFDGDVPGIWSWTQSPGSMLGSFASMRGASSFGLSYPKIYIDGIEVANPLLVTRFTPAAIDRIEVIRGPQGSALYGTDAISGVVNIVTRHEGTGLDGNHATLGSSAGLVQSDFANGVMAQNHTLSLVAGTPQRSMDLHVSAGTVGDFVPNGYSRDLLAMGSARVIRARSTFSTTGRFYAQEAGSATSPLLPQPVDTTSVFQNNKASPQTIQEYTLGTTATFAPNDRWTHTFVAGIDGYRLSNVQTGNLPVASPTDSALRAAEGSAARGTLRATSAVRFGHNDSTNATLTFSAEHGVYRGEVSSMNASIAIPHHEMQTASRPLESVMWQTNTGVTTQLAAALENTWFISGGVRIERDSRLPDSKTTVLPMLGVAFVKDVHDFTMKLRGAYGEGIRPPTTSSRPMLSQLMYGATQSALRAERQTGTEAGFDLAFRHALNLRITRFDQVASGLIQQVPLVGVTTGGSIGSMIGPGVGSTFENPVSPRMEYELENVGEILNRGWEMEGSFNLSKLTVSGTYSIVSSRVARLAPDYKGDLMAGDPMLQVPARTAALNLSYSGRRWLTTLGASRAFDWIAYDELARARDFASGTYPLQNLVGPQLRNYWRRYDGSVRLRASASRDFRNIFTFEISGENLLNYQVNEPDNITIVPGRTIMSGVRVRF